MILYFISIPCVVYTLFTILYSCHNWISIFLHLTILHTLFQHPSFRICFLFQNILHLTVLDASKKYYVYQKRFSLNFKRCLYVKKYDDIAVSMHNVIIIIIDHDITLLLV